MNTKDNIKESNISILVYFILFYINIVLGYHHNKLEL